MPTSSPSEHINKTALARRLGCTTRTLSNYIESGVLPAPHRRGRDAVWQWSQLRELADAPAPPLRLQQRQREGVLARLACAEPDSAEDDRAAPTMGAGRQEAGPAPAGAPPAAVPAAIPGGIPAGVPIYAHARPRTRSEVLEEIRVLKSVAKDITAERQQEPRGSPLRDELWAECRAVQQERDCLERGLQEHFLPGHSADQLLLPYEFLCSPLFAVRSASRPRESRVDIELAVNGQPCARYQGPELRQDDALLFAALVNLAQHYQVDTTVGFNVQGLCEAVWGHYNGPNRERLRQGIERLTQAELRYTDLCCRLVGSLTFIDSEGEAQTLRSGFSAQKAAMKAQGMAPVLLQGSGDVAAMVRIIHGLRLGLRVSQPGSSSGQ